MTNKFCNENYLFFQKNYNILNDTKIEMNFYRLIYSLDEKKHKILDEILLEKIRQNWNAVQHYLVLLKSTFKQIKSAGNLEGFQIEHLMKDFKVAEKNIKTPKTFLKYVKALIYRKNLYNEVKELLLILSNKYTCELILNKNLKKEKCSKKYIEKVIKLANGHFDILCKLLYPKTTSLKNGFGKEEYNTVYKFFRCLRLMEKHEIDPIKALKIKVPKKPTNKDVSRVLDELEVNYIIESGNDFDDKPETVNGISEYILLMKRRGHSLWYTINYIWKHLYGKEPEGDICNANVVSNYEIEMQKGGYKTTIKLFVLCRDGFISNINIFQEF